MTTEPIPASHEALRVGEADLERIELPTYNPPWPKPLGEAARIGLVGRIVDRIEPTTEGDPNAIVLQLLAGVGNLLGSGPHVVIDEKRHPLKIWVLVVGATADGKKGTGANRVFSLLDQVDPSWRLRRKNGIASGEAIVHQVRDDVVRIRRVKKSDGTETETGETVEGEKDKRLLLKEEEFSRVLRLARRDGATLSATIREAWDSSTLMTTSKVAPETATNAHVTIIGHITPEELRKYLSDTELANGFANRFLLACSRRSKRLSRPPQLQWQARSELTGELRRVVDRVRRRSGDAQQIALSEDSWRLWDAMKTEIEQEVEAMGRARLLVTKVVTRGPPYVLRIAALYATLEGTWTVEPTHLQAAREVWRYSVDSARVLFGDGLSDADATRVVEALEEQPEGRLKRLEIHTLFHRHRSQQDLDRLRDLLIATGRIEAFREVTPGKGRPLEWWVHKRGE